MKQDKRQVQRVTLDSAIEGTLNKQTVTVIDISTTGVRVEHATPIAGRKVVDLRLNADGQEVLVTCEMVRSRLQRSALDRNSIVYCSGLRFIDPTQQSRVAIRHFVANLVAGRVSDEQRAAEVLSVAV